MPTGDEDGAGDVDPHPTRRPHHVLHEQHRADDGQRGDDHVDAERPPPRVVGGEEAADDGTEGGGDARGGAPRRERRRPFPALERPGEDGERRRHHQRGTDALDDRLAEDQLADRRRDRRQQRADAEQGQPDDEDPAVPVHVAEPAPDDQQGREGQCIAGDDPLEARQGGVQVAQDRRDRDVEHRVVEHHDEDGQDRNRQCDPAPGVQLLGPCHRGARVLTRCRSPQELTRRAPAQVSRWTPASPLRSGS